MEVLSASHSSMAVLLYLPVDPSAMCCNVWVPDDVDLAAIRSSRLLLCHTCPPTHVFTDVFRTSAWRLTPLLVWFAIALADRSTVR